MSYWWEDAKRIAEDGRVTRSEILTGGDRRAVADALKRVGAARDRQWSLGGPVEYIDVPGVGKWQGQDRDGTFARWLIDRLPQGGFSSKSTDATDVTRITEGEKTAVQVGEDPQKVAEKVSKQIQTTEMSDSDAIMDSSGLNDTDNAQSAVSRVISPFGRAIGESLPVDAVPTDRWGSSTNSTSPTATSSSSADSKTGSSTTLVLGLIGAAAVALAVFGGSY
jgi:hypothetical protein